MLELDTGFSSIQALTPYSPWLSELITQPKVLLGYWLHKQPHPAHKSFYTYTHNELFQLHLLLPYVSVKCKEPLGKRSET